MKIVYKYILSIYFIIYSDLVLRLITLTVFLSAIHRYYPPTNENGTLSFISEKTYKALSDPQANVKFS